jgi:methylmalonyl-CoA/ethylmalonyl-CoA epimerase
MTPIRRLDHVAILVRDTDEALRAFSDRLGLAVVSGEELPALRVRLTYLDAGNALLQLVQPLDAESELGQELERRGEGLHHVCFGVDDVAEGAAELAGPDATEVRLGSGRGRTSAFVPGGPVHGVRFECTEFRREEDVDQVAGWLPPR